MKSLLALLIFAGINASALELKDIVGKYAVGSGCDMSVSPKRVYITLKSYKNTGKPYLEVYFYGEDATFTEISLESSTKEVIGSDGRKWTSIKTVQNSMDSLISTQILFNGNKASAQTTVESLKKQNGFLVYDSLMTNANGQKMLADHCPLYKTN